MKKLKQKTKQKLVISSSVSFKKEITFWKNKMTKDDFNVIDYPKAIKKDAGFFKRYQKIHAEFYKNLTRTDVLIALNLDKNGIKNYIGAAVFAEIAFAIGLNLTQNKKIKIYCLNLIPKNLPPSPELNLWKKLGWIRIWRNNGKK